MSRKPAEALLIENDQHDKRMQKKIHSQLEERNQNRLADMQNKRDEIEGEKVTEEKSDFFSKNFKNEIAVIEEMLNCKELNISDRAVVVDHFDAITASFHRLRKFFNDSVMFLPKFKSRKSMSQLNELEQKINAKRAEMIPKKKFAFKSKAKKIESKSNISNDPPATGNVSKAGAMVAKFSNEFLVKDKTDETIRLNEQEINQRDVSLSNLKNCTIFLHGAPGTVHISDVEKCVVSIGPVSGSVFVDRCVDSRLSTGCQQLRVHHTKRTDFYLHVTSRAIIEDTSDIRVAPYNTNYPELDSHFKLAGLDKSTNNWDKVDDFNWLAMSTHSPNWAVLEESKRITEQT
uniref:C-CAP/cofactor C-like domain-containing protein n=1 Tax=Ciona savignyi TaxID=51511 RepID=H2ZJ53_CIOSA